MEEPWCEPWGAWDANGYLWQAGWTDEAWGNGSEGWGDCWSGSAWAGDAWWSEAWPAAQPSFSPSEEQTARVHFAKTYQVLSEALEAHPNAFRGEAFLDLGCAPGGFASRLLEERSDSRGYGVTLPVAKGGFPVLVEHEPRLFVQSCNLMELTGVDDLLCPELVDVVMADAQDLGRRIKDEEKGNKPKKGYGGGVGASCTVLGIWAMTLQELRLGLGKLRDRGTLFFRFGWRGRGHREEVWYHEATTRLLAFLVAHFAEVRPFKSETSHQADSSFYVLGTGFQREAFALDKELETAVAEILACQRPVDLPDKMVVLEQFATPEARACVEAMLENVGRARAIGMATRQALESRQHSEMAAITISPVPLSLTLQGIRERLARFGKIAHVRRRSHAVGVGADAFVQFTQATHAAAALRAIREQGVLGGNITAKLAKC